MFARVTALHGSADSVDKATDDVRNTVIPAARQLSGFQGMIVLADRASGKTMGITLWESEDAMKASEEAANKLRTGAADASGSQISSVEHFEVAIDERV